MKLNRIFTGYVHSSNVARHLQRLGATALVALALLNPAATAYAQAPDPDAGDAPDRSNSLGQPMETYPGSGVGANYPTVYKDPVGIPGPIHWYATKDAWLGGKVSSEADADQMPDGDGLTNIDPLANLADRDGYDDGVYLETLRMEECSRTEFRYNVTVAAPVAPERYVNVWFDFNRDGDWEDTVLCKQNGQVVKVHEWAVQDQVVSGALAPGSYNFSSGPVWVTNPPSTKDPLWMRITLSEQKAPIAPGLGMADGRGPVHGYRVGETEDYLLVGK